MGCGQQSCLLRGGGLVSVPVRECMSSEGEGGQLPLGIQGPVRLLPLPQLVMFPHAMQPLRISQPQECRLLRDALAGDRLLVLATLREGIAAAGQPRPALHPAVCVCRLVSHWQAAEDCHNILLVGAQRAILQRELDGDWPYRSGMVDLTEAVVANDTQASSSGGGQTAAAVGSGGQAAFLLAAREAAKRRLLQAFAEALPAAATVQQNLHELMGSSMELAAITDIIAFTLPLPLEHKLALLAEADAIRRAQTLEQMLVQQPALAGASGGFPPRFSLN